MGSEMCIRDSANLDFFHDSSSSSHAVDHGEDNGSDYDDGGDGDSHDQADIVSFLFFGFCGW